MGELAVLVVLGVVYAAFFWLPARLQRSVGIMAAVVLLVVCIAVSVGGALAEPSNQFVDLGPYFRTILGATFAGAPFAALLFHLTHRERGAVSSQILAFLGGGVLSLVFGYVAAFVY